jgi:hypothetical protein
MGHLQLAASIFAFTPIGVDSFGRIKENAQSSG